ncbi:maleylpyruvate isomerase family mycothiol-dependent enzyme [Actinomadura alba]|uniref:Maleylpyruvate isomerase family mycothiol-dependent enzyme n=1 Tax=Actinomadura alba TaxID=406431 RepID=A0ABR7M0S5_9ACTN|nr:maleylpyruvate isomerase family mycothiol-dependent enzyme [Actinomadura alba]MBC6470716.1 maleylpyruvate isomerase family mycothiol-dependent enzyme [Actinomadura alba]
MNPFDDDMPGNVAAFEQTVRSTIALSETFGAAEWDLPTECPGWTVRDQVAHIVGVERMLLGDPPEEHTLPAELPHVRNDFGRLLEIAVDARRTTSPETVLAELRETLSRRLTALAAIDPRRQITSPDGRPGPYSRFMMFRAFDCWVHEQDIRRAVGRPGNLDAPAAERARHILGSGMPAVVAKRAGAGPGSSVIFKITGPPTFRSCILVGDDGRARWAEPEPNPTVTLAMDWEAYMRLAAGRCAPTAVDIAIDGDHELAGRVLGNMTVTP